jgi:hypothetical protein
MPRAPRVAFVTWSGLPDLAPDDQLAAAALERDGVAVARVAWDAAVEWRDYACIVLRSCWDYHLRPVEFGEWLRHGARAALPFQNPVPLLQWNLDKRYLRDLAAEGVPIVPTSWVEPGETATLPELLAREGWDDAVVKPTLSASAHGTWRTTSAGAADDAARFREDCARGSVMLQPFQPAVVAHGEWSLVFIAGAFSHAVLKRPAAHDFRVQAEFGGSAIAAHPPAALVVQARRVVEVAESLCGARCLYARVDGCAIDGTLVLLELEVLEPSLFLQHADGAPERLAGAVLARL